MVSNGMLNNATENNTENMVDDDVTVTNDETSFTNSAGKSLTSLAKILTFLLVFSFISPCEAIICQVCFISITFILAYMFIIVIQKIF